MSGDLPLTGLGIVEYGRDLPTRYAGFLLAELGAEVTALRATPDDRHPVLDRQKHLAVLGGTPARWALDAADAVVADRPITAATGADVVWCDVSGWGPAGPRRAEPFDDALVAALAGIQTFQWSWSGRPVWLVTPLVGYLTGIMAALGVVAALFARRRGASGQRLAVSALDAAFTLNCGRFVVAPGFEGSLSEQGDPHGPYPTYAIYQTLDGWLFIGALTAAFWVNLATCVDRLDLLADPRLPESPMGVSTPEAKRIMREALEAAFRTRTTAAWIEALQAADVPCGQVRSRADCLRDPAARAGGHAIAIEDPHLGATWQPGPPAEFRQGDVVLPVGKRPPVPPARPLDGIRVVDFTTFIAGPFCPRLLADLGAEVLKIEPRGGDPFRFVQYGFVGWNRGKRSVVLDVKSDDGANAMRALARSSDVLVDNVRPGVMNRLGLDDASLAALRPDLVRLSITGYGSSGPDALRPGFDPVFQARCGIMRAQGGDEEPVVHTIAYNDYCAGALGALAAVAALYAREVGGRGQRVDVSLFRTALVDQAADMLLAPGVEPATSGGRDFVGPSASRRLYECTDGWICVAAGDEEARSGLAALAGIASHDDAPDGEVARALEALFASLGRAEALEGLRRQRIPAAPCLRFPELLADPQVAANRCLIEVQDELLGPVVMAGPAIHFERTPIAYDRGAPKLGADTDAVLGGLPSGRRT
jgi:crotonobetainyl-CoA:carnitine CoA-transferase CaiB-like acyl-CoA transferase